VFERFTDRARRVMVLAQEQARLLAHPFIGAEHILLGLLAENEGVAAQALASTGIDLQLARDRVGELEGPTSTTPGGSPPFTPSAKKVLEGSLRAALTKGHSFIGTEHLLLALLDREDGVAISVLESLGSDRDDLRVRVENLMAGHAPDDPAAAAERRQARIHVLEGILLGMDNFADVIAVVQDCPDRSSTLRVLRAAPFGLTEIQASHVLDLTVASVTRENRQRLADELRALQLEE